MVRSLMDCVPDYAGNWPTTTPCMLLSMSYVGTIGGSSVWHPPIWPCAETASCWVSLGKHTTQLLRCGAWWKVRLATGASGINMPPTGTGLSGGRGHPELLEMEWKDADEWVCMNVSVRVCMCVCVGSLECAQRRGPMVNIGHTPSSRADGAQLLSLEVACFLGQLRTGRVRRLARDRRDVAYRGETLSQLTPGASARSGSMRAGVGFLVLSW